MQPVLNFPWIDIRTTLDDNPFASADQMDIPFFIHDPEMAHAEAIVIGKACRGLGGLEAVYTPDRLRGNSARHAGAPEGVLEFRLGQARIQGDYDVTNYETANKKTTNSGYLRKHNRDPVT